VREGVSFVVPVHNGAACLPEAFAAILAQQDGRPMEIVFVDDRSSDGSRQLLQQYAARSSLVRIVDGDGRGAAAAINAGIRAARFPVICQVDQDVVLRPGWMAVLTAELDDPQVAAAQGYYETDPAGSLYARAMGRDLEQRYVAIKGPETGHVCTGNAVYRAAALRAVGLVDETLGYGYDNDMSYRLQAAGYRLVLNQAARSLHRWRDGLRGYLVQQYGFGFGRLDLVAKHPRRVAGDSVSPAAMMAHPILLGLALATLVAAALSALAGSPPGPLVLASSAIVGGLALERMVAGVRAAQRFRDPTPLVFPVLHLARDLAWVAAILVWLGKRLTGRGSVPADSMRPRVVHAAWPSPKRPAR
jgi:hypothetical protein